MKRLVPIVVAGALALAAAPGCGPSASNGPNSPGGPNDPADPAAASVQELFDGLPANALPKDKDDTIRIDRANDWLKTNAPGKRFACNYPVGDVSLSRMGETRYYEVTFWYGGSDDKKNKVFVKVNGVPYEVRPTHYYYESHKIVLSDVEDDFADRLSGLKNKVVKLSATVESASLTEGRLVVVAKDFTFDGMKTGLPRALDRLKAAADPAARKAAIDEVMRRTPRAGDPKESLAALADLRKDKDDGVRQAAALATASLDPKGKIEPGVVPRKASLDGKLTKLLRILYVPESESDYGKTTVHDGGVSADYPEYQGYKNIPAGHWVYLYPYWYVWEEPK
jgi:hypothetical protein